MTPQLQTLRIQNLAIIENCEIDFTSGLNIITGETGAGKSIIIEALELILGKNTEESLIKSGKDEAFIEAIFSPELIIQRKLRRGKPSQTLINNETVTLKTLKTTTSPRLQITAQDDTGLLKDPIAQLTLLDATNPTEITPLLITYKTARSHYQSAKSKLETARSLADASTQEKDFLDFQIDDIAQHNFEPGEEDELNNARSLAKNTNTITENSTQIITKITQSSALISEILHHNSKLPESDLKEKLDTDITAAQETIDAYAPELQSLRSELTTRNLDINHIESRLDTIFKLKTKYKQQTLDTLINYLQDLQAKRAIMETATDSLSTLEETLKEAEEKLNKISKKLTKTRQIIAETLENNIISAMKDLGFNDVKFKIDFTPAETYLETGKDTLIFQISTNPGHPPKPLHKIASGGEKSRIMLALKSIPTQTEKSTLIFDEIDTGIGGLTANKIGEKLAQIAKTNQTIVITHLPQIATHATTHFKIEKTVIQANTAVIITELKPEEKTSELNRMIGGEKLKERLTPKQSN